MSAQIEIISQEEKIELIISGMIDENFKGPEINLKENQALVLNMNEVTKINSRGVKCWILFMNNFELKKIIYLNVPIPIVEQMDMVHGFLNETAIVETFYAPYYDKKSNKSVSVLLNAKDVVNKKAPVMKNSEGEELEFDALEESYFDFLDN